MSRSHKSRMKPYPCNCHRPKSEVLPPGDRRALSESVSDLVLARDEWTAEEARATWVEEEDVDDDRDPHLAMLDAWSDLRGEANRAVLGDDPW